MRQYHRRLFLTCLEDRAVPAALCVAPDGVDAAGRGSPTAPYRSIQAAVRAAATGDTVLVAGGTYTYDAAAAAGAISASFVNPEVNQVVAIAEKKIAIYGGYSKADGFTVANPSANPTVIDGQGKYRGIYVVATTAAVGFDLQGVTIKNGFATPRPNGQADQANSAYGGGLYIDLGDKRTAGNAQPFTIKNVTFDGNSANGAAPVPSIPQAVLGGAGQGGAIYAIGANNILLDSVIFRNNKAVGGPGGTTARGGVAQGGAVALNYANVTGTNLLFDGNQALGGTNNGVTSNGSSIPADALGGAVGLQFDCTGTFTNVTAVNNLARGGDNASTAAGARGGDAFGGAFWCETAVLLTIRDANIANNKAEGGDGQKGGDAGGGAIETDNTSLTLDRVKMVKNIAQGGSGSGGGAFGAPTGGAIYSFRVDKGDVTPDKRRGTITISNSLIAANAILLDTGAPAGSSGGGGGLRLNGVEGNLTNVTIADNVISPQLIFGQAMILQHDGTATKSVVTLTDSILSGHPDAAVGAVTLFQGETLNLNRVLTFNNKVDFVATSGGTEPDGVINGRTSVITADPQFTAPGGATLDYSLKTGSRAVNAGGTATSNDLANGVRTGNADLGSYELGSAGTLPALAAPVGAATTTSTPAFNTFPAAPPPPPPPPPAALVGYPQFLVGADVGGGPGVNLYNANQTVRTGGFAFTDTAFTGGVRTAAADFNGDGVADLVVGTGPGTATKVRVLDGVDRRVLADINPFESAFTGGVYVAAGDLNGDGTPDLVITPDEGGGPRVDAYSGAGFGKIVSFFGIDDPNFRGGARASTGDVNGDGRTDLVVVAGFGGGPRVAGFDGTSVSGTPRRLFADFFAFEKALSNGVFIAVGDVSGDGKADLIFGGGPGGGPRVRIASGAALTTVPAFVSLDDVQGTAQLANFFGGDESSRGGIRLAVKNLDSDNRADLLVGAGSGAGSRVTAYFGKNIPTGGTPSQAFAFDAFPSFSGGVFVG